MTAEDHHTETSERVLLKAEIAIGVGGVAPVREIGIIVVAGDGTIVEVGPVAEISGGYDREESHQIIMPGVLNCHVHMTDANIESPVGGGSGLAVWVQDLLAARRNGSADSATIASVLDTMQKLGTVAIGEVTNDRSTLEGIRRSGIRCRYIHELLAFPAARAQSALERATADLADEENISIAPGLHAPYSVSPELHRRASDWSRRIGRNLFEHLAEDPDERRLYESGSGPWRALLERLGSWDPDWSVPGCSPIEFLERLGVIDERFVAVHLADATADEIEMLAARGARAILSPRSNLHITGLIPPVAEIVRSGMRFAFGTDGRGSSATVDVFDEAATIIRHDIGLPPLRLLEALTVDAANILQMPDLGSIEVGNAPGLISVRTNGRTNDPAELERAIILDGLRARIC